MPLPPLLFGPLCGPPERPCCSVALPPPAPGADPYPIGALTRLLDPGAPAEGVPPFTVYRFDSINRPDPLTIAARTRDAVLTRLAEHLAGCA